MRDHYVFRITYEQRQSQGVWHAQDDYEHRSWSEPLEFSSLYVASLEEVARAHFDYWAKIGEPKENPVVVKKVENLGQVRVLLEMRG